MKQNGMCKKMKPITLNANTNILHTHTSFTQDICKAKL